MPELLDNVFRGLLKVELAVPFIGANEVADETARETAGKTASGGAGRGLCARCQSW